MMTTPAPTALSVVVITPGSIDLVRRTLAHLRAQTEAARIELVLVAPSRAELGLEHDEITGFGSCRIVEAGPLVSGPAARAAGVRAATSPYVAMAEEHAFPATDWAAALLETHARGYDVVGPAMHNANPATALSWANLITEYGPWMAREVDDGVEHLPGHNDSYRRELLVAYGDRLEAMLDAESVAHWDLRTRGCRLCLQPAARTYHLNMSRWSSTLRLRLNAGRAFAAARARSWPPGKRLFYLAASPLIPLVRLRRALVDARRIGRSQTLPRATTLFMCITLVLDGLGELVGYASGAGASGAHLTNLEFRREEHLNASDRAALAGTTSTEAPCRCCPASA